MPITMRNQKKKPPPRPPPPNFSKYKSKSTYNLNQPNQNSNLIEWSPPNSPTTDRNRHFGGSVSSSFSSSTSSLASSKKSFELESPVSSNLWPLSNQHNCVPNNSVAINTNGTFQSYLVPPPSISAKSNLTSSNGLNIPSVFGPTIIRPQTAKKSTKVENAKLPSPTLPMPKIPPPSPPKVDVEVETSYGVALYDYPGSDPSDLTFQEGDIIIIIKRINNEWLYGKNFDKEGMFPENFIEVQVPLKSEENIVTAVYDFKPEMEGDLGFQAGEKIKIIRKISEEWLYGRSENGEGQFPRNFVNRIPKNL
ncbi:uncharacterized protein B0303.7 [Cylas formicarius]|uniref:uncharacterized protein B0303.7 n=1 Tax=Cylas formicarius TaxID=197179 RepID=UPI0029585F77|nr:uncharacterized protein B0303.7 [Cylas formicarius]